MAEYNPDDINAICDLAMLDTETAVEESDKIFIKVKKLCKPLILSRKSIKIKILWQINQVKSYIDSNAANEKILLKHIGTLSKLLDQCNKVGEEIIGQFQSSGLSELSSKIYDYEIETQMSYEYMVQSQIGEFEDIADVLNKQNVQSNSVTNKQVSSHSVRTVRPPEITLIHFSGLSHEDYRHFFQIFQSAIGLNKSLSDADKLLHLNTLLNGYARKVIQHLSFTDSNYRVAIDLLEKEFLDKDFLIDSIFTKILNIDLMYSNSYESLRDNLNTLRAFLYELTDLKCDFFNEDSSGCKLLAHILSTKLPKGFKIELTHRIGSAYPTVKQITDNFTDCLRTMQRNNIFIGGAKTKVYRKPDLEKGTLNYKADTKFVRSYSDPDLKKRHNVTYFKDNKPTLSNYKTEIINHNSKVKSNNLDIKPCKFCGKNHRYYLCDEYDTLDKRILRCRELNLCKYCVSSLHTSEKCPGKNNKLTYKCFRCRESSHISAMCPKQASDVYTSSNLCFASSSVAPQIFMLPLIEVVLGRGRNAFTVLCLCDSGSQKSYISGNLAKSLGVPINKNSSRTYKLKTFLGAQDRHLNETVLDAYINSNEKYQLPMLIDDKLDLNFQITGLTDMLANIKSQGVKLASNCLNNLKSNNITQIHCLLGIDYLQYLNKWKLVRCLDGFAYETDFGIVPIGNVKNFLTSSQIKRLFPHSIIESNALDQISIENNNNKNNEQILINHIIEPHSNYFDILSFHNKQDEINTDLGLEYLYSLEQLGIPPNIEESTYDQVKVEEFRKGIEFRDNKYWVALPWHSELLPEVQSNYYIALRSLDRVEKNLNDKNLIDDYNNIFNDMLNETIIEEFNVHPKDYNNYIFVPHHPVIKTETVSTTKIRPVFNCSMKTKNSISLNQASYGGIDLLTSLLKLIFQFRTNKYIMLGDIRKAYHMVKLNLIEDRNRLCFFWRYKNKLKTFRFCSAPFGLKSSGFLLNYLIKYHSSLYPDDLCTHILSNNFYCDNLIYTNDSPEILTNMYRTCCSRMGKAGFDLRNWTSNLPSLITEFQVDLKNSPHNESFDKVLGYYYFPKTDEMRLADYNINSNACTKREILSQSSKIFDPLNIFSPVTVKSKIFMRDLWLKGYGWDENIDSDMLDKWKKIAVDLDDLQQFKFPRNSIQMQKSDNHIELNCFTDASNSTYGMIVYATSKLGSNLIYSKVKVAPNKGLTIPSLELLAVYLTFKCLPTVIEAISYDFSISKLTMFTDSQLVLNWLLNKTSKIQRIFVKNRITEIEQMSKKLKSNLNLDINYQYVNSGENPADLLTRGLSYKKFKSEFSHYYVGPAWLILQSHCWPKYELKSVADNSKCKINVVNLATIANENANPIIDIYRYSNFNKLIKVTSLVFKFIQILKKKSIEHIYNKARIFWVKIAQASAFSNCSDFLADQNKNVTIPNLVSRLNLFQDKDKLLRSKGRIGRCNVFNYDVINPILLPKTHYFTKLYIMHCHNECKHLGIGSTLNYIRLQGFWITRARQSIKDVISHCVVCQKFNNLAFKYPKLTNIPVSAMRLIKPFSSLGIDFTGHIWIVDEKGHSSKYYILLYTCLTIRACHFDLLPDMSTKQVLNSFQRFCCLYGIPDFLYSDNFSSFIQSGQILEKSLHSSDFQDFLDRSNIKHVRIPVKSPWIAGQWERQVGTLKKCLYKTIGRKKLNYYDMITVLASIKCIVNDRPLTYRFSDSSEITPITPNSFLKIHSNKNLIFRESQEPNPPSDMPDHNELNEGLINQFELYEYFRSVWSNEYLLSLREFSRDLFQIDWINRINLDDIVLIKDTMKSRPFWQMARVVELIHGHDGIIRSARVVKSSKDKPVLHPINHLYPLEVSVTHDGTQPFNRNITSNAGGSDIEPNMLNTEPLIECTESVSYNDSDNLDSIEESNICDTNETEIESVGSHRPQRRAAKQFKQFMIDKLPHL